MSFRPAVASLVSLTLAAGVVVPSLAHAGTFDAAGKFVADPGAVLTMDFDTVTPDQATAGLVAGTEAGGPLQGAGYATLTSTQSYLEQALPADLEGGTYTLRFFARHNRVVGGVTVSYSTLDTDFGDPSFYATAFPTGVVTSDGWYEVATAPFSLDPTRAFAASLFLYASAADLDGLELVREAAPATPIKACSKAYDAACSAHEFCASGFCRDGNVSVPSVPSEAGGPAQLAAYLQSRVDHFFGGKYTRTERLPLADEVFTGMASAASRWETWNGFATALHRLRDWHTSMTGPNDVEGRGAFPLCFVEGSADSSQTAAATDPTLPVDVIVAYNNGDLVSSSNLGAGDRLVAIDGMHPFAWMDSLDAVDWGYWHSIDPDGHAEAAERLRNNIRRFAHELSIVRCDKTTFVCNATAETVLVSDLPRTEPQNYPTCDHRPSYIVDGIDATTHRVRKPVVGPVLGTTADEAINGMVWNDVIAESDANPYAAVLAQLTTGAKGVVLDHRTGNGGTENAAEFLTQPFRDVALLGASTSFNLTLGLFDDPFDGLAIFNARKNLGADGYNVGASTFNPALRTALLLARDGSASDWFPAGMKGAPNVRIFGRKTAGAFSSFFQFDYYGNLVWQFGSGDFIQADGTPHLGHGVEPDEDILPKQSDLLQGKDTVALRALAWIREGVTP